MKKIYLLILVSVTLLTACGGFSFKKVGDQYVDEEYNIKFKDIGERWEKQDPGMAKKSGTIHYFFDKENHARVWMRATRYENDPVLPLKEGAGSYVARKANQYSWNELVVVSEDFDEFNGKKAFWKVYEYKLGSKSKKEKIYRVYHDKIAYQFRLRCSKERFDGLLPEFDAWLKTIEFIK